jgi:hypothetical protein
VTKRVLNAAMGKGHGKRATGKGDDISAEARLAQRQCSAVRRTTSFKEKGEIKTPEVNRAKVVFPETL